MPFTLNVNPITLDEFGIITLILFALLGLVMGSFASALIHRVPSGAGVFGPRQRSACPKCGHILGVRDLIPLFSWLLTRGQCRHCGADIPLLYPVLELTAALLALAILIFYPAISLSQSLVAVAALPFLLALLVIDIRYKILPNILVGIVFALGIANVGLEAAVRPVAWQEILIEHVGGALVFMVLALFLSMIMAGILKKPALGLGDVKFFAVAGLWLGVSALGLFCILGGGIGVIFGAAWQKLKGEALFPFGPALIVSFFILLLMNGSHAL